MARFETLLEASVASVAAFGTWAQRTGRILLSLLRPCGYFSHTLVQFQASFDSALKILPFCWACPLASDTMIDYQGDGSVSQSEEGHSETDVDH